MAMSAQGAKNMLKKIALEEHFLSPGLVEYWMPTVAGIDPAIATRLYSRLNDLGEQRLNAMDGAGIEHAVLSIAGPGVQAERDTATATRRASEANDFLAREIYKRPDRYFGFAHLAMQDPRAAAKELERCVTQLGFDGAMINGHTNGHYLDEPGFDPFWERVGALDVPVYLHGADPVVPAPVLDGMPVLRRAVWEWGFETASHALRLVYGGVFDRFPAVRIVLGHMGETLPYVMAQLDSRTRLHGETLAKPPSRYLKDNVLVTISGMLATEPLYCALGALGADRVLFAADYPFESCEEAGRFIDTVRLDEGVRASVAYHNAARLFGLSSAP
jgi:2,3-dihydroxybenzoate decarboxylase